MDIIDIIIPTYNRTFESQQKTLNSLPAYLKPHTYLVVREEQVADYLHIAFNHGCNIHALPAGSSGIAQARKQIAEWREGTRYWVVEDDIQFRCVEWVPNPVTGKPYTETTRATEPQFREAITDINRFLDEGFMFGASHVANIPPNPKGYDVCSRIWTNVFYSENLPVNELDWGESYEIMPEDFHVALQLLQKGHASIILHKFRTSPVGGVNTVGGCADYRTIKNHNDGQELLAKLHPQFVKVYSKTQKTGPWAGVPKNALRIQWKKAFQSSGKVLPGVPSWAKGE